ncbi:protein NipSnap homolog 3A-like [Styela clava]
MLNISLRLSAIKRIFSNGIAASSSRYVSTDTGESNIYELRKYSLTPHGMPKFLELLEKNYHLRTQHSPFWGYWIADLGALNQVIHIWEYENFAHRTAVRTALAKDKEWQESFVQKAFPYVAHQTNSIVLKANWCDLHMDKTDTGCFELSTYGMRVGGPRVWEENLKSSLLAHARLEYADLIGTWYTDVGDHNTVEVLWRYESADARREGRNKAHSDRIVVNKVRDNLKNVVSHRNVLMSPLPFLKR